MDQKELDALARALEENGLLDDGGLEWRALDTVDSTNRECLRLLRETGAGRCLVLADRQTAGRGRSGHSFFSPPGAGLYLSLGFPMALGPEGPAGLTTLAAVAAAEEIEALCGKRCGIKWVNDLFYRGKKVCGILAEAVDGLVIVGIGVNLGRPDRVPPELRDIMGWLDAPSIRPALAAGIARRIFCRRPGDLSHMAAYRERSIVLGRRVRFALDGQPQEALAESIRDDGALVLRRDDGSSLPLSFGEISIKL